MRFRSDVSSSFPVSVRNIVHRHKANACVQLYTASGNAPERKVRLRIGTAIVWIELFPAYSGFLIKSGSQLMQNKEIVARFREKGNADKFAEKANRRTFESVTIEKRNELWEVRLTPVRKIPKFEHLKA